MCEYRTQYKEGAKELMEDSNKIDKIMKVVKENLELSVSICLEYGFIGTADHIEKALYALADAKVTKELEQSQKIDLEKIKELREQQEPTKDNPLESQISAEEAKQLVHKFANIANEDTQEREEINE